MSKLIRNMSTPESRAFWEGVKESAALVRDAPDWMKVGINLSENYVTFRGEDPVPPPLAENERSMRGEPCSVLLT